MDVRVLGSIEVYNGHLLALGGPRQRRILAALAMRSGEVLSIDQLVDITWSGEDPPAKAEQVKFVGSAETSWLKRGMWVSFVATFDVKKQRPAAAVRQSSTIR